jgi:hypothetical protein
MMELLPPVGCADVATKRDLDQLEERMDLRFDATVSSFRADLAESGRRMQGVFLTAIVAATSLIAALSVFGPN